MRHETAFPTHKVLGKYCWDCKAKTQAGLPGWTRASHSDHYADVRNLEPKETREASRSALYIGANPYVHLTSVVWANGDTARGKDQTQCRDCEKHCGKPVDRAFDWGIDPYASRAKRC